MARNPLTAGTGLLKAAALALPILAGCEGSEFIDLELPEAVNAGVPFEASVTNAFNDGFVPLSTVNASIVHAALVPESWTATSATYSGTKGAAPFSVPVTISDAPPETSEEFVELLFLEISELIGEEFDVTTCFGSVTLREGDTPDSPVIATLYTGGATEPFSPRTAGALDLTEYADESVYLYSEVGSCLGPSGLFLDNFVLNAGTGNLVSNPSFESGLTDWVEDFSTEGCVNEVLEEGEITDGAGGWTTPAPSDGTLLYASDATDPSSCILAQEIALPVSAGATTFTADVGANFEVPFLFFLDIGTPEVPEGQKLIWFRTADIDDFGDFGAGDTATLEIDFVASEEVGGTTDIVFFHGYYSELDEDDIILPVAAVEQVMRRLPGSPPPPVLAPLATPGFVGAGIWFSTISGGPPQPDSIQSSIMVLAATIAAPVPALGGFLLVCLSAALAVVGLRRQRHLKSRR